MTAGASAVLVLIAGGAAGVAALTDKEPRIVRAVGQDKPVAVDPPTLAGEPAGMPPADAGLGDQAAQVRERAVEEADRTAPRTPKKQPVEQQAQVAAPPVTVAKPAVPAQPVVTTRTETETRAIPFRTTLVRDPGLPRGRKRIQTEGVPGEQTLRYAVTVTDGQPTERRLMGSTVTRQPQQRVVAFGTGRGGWDCRPDRGGCKPGGRAAGCVAPKPESASLPLGGTIPLLDEDLAMIDQLELKQGALC